MSDPIVITGAGLNCCLGLNRNDVWCAVREGRCGIGPLTALEQPDDAREGGQAPALRDDADADQPREVRYLRSAIAEALCEAGLDREHWPAAHRVGVVLGTTLAGMRAGGNFLRTNDANSLDTFLAGSTLSRAIAGLGIEGFSATTCAACASGLSAIAMAMTLLRRGELDVVIAGGYDPISEYVYAGFNSLRLIAPGPPLPFSRNRQGMKLGEGSGIVILESASHASSRGAKPLATVLGYGESSDAHHLTKPQPEGIGAAQAINAALRDAGVDRDEIDLISAHATATPNNDAAEFAAYQSVFGKRLPHVNVTAFKSHLGHTLGAAGAIELILSMMAMQEATVPPLANVQAGDIEFDGLNVVTGSARRTPIRHSINLSLGFGGANSCIVLGPPRDAPIVATTARMQHEVCITGVAVIAPGCIGNDALLDRLNGTTPRPPELTGSVDEADLLPLFSNARRVRRFSTFVKLMLASTNLAVQDAGLDTTEGQRLIEDFSALLGSTLGTVEYTVAYYSQVVREGIDAANPMLFAEGVPNVASAQLSLLLNLRGSSQTIIGTRIAGLDALHLARQRIAEGSAQRLIVGAAEESGELIGRAFATCAPDSAAAPVATGAGAVALILESREAAIARGATIKAVLQHSAAVRTSCASSDDRVRIGCKALDHLDRPQHVLCASNGTWIDRIEKLAMMKFRSESSVVGSLHGYLPNMLSVSPLAAVAAYTLQHRLAPYRSSPQDPKGIVGATGLEQPPSIGILACDEYGSATAVRLGVA